jgi:hypothetical protein
MLRSTLVVLAVLAVATSSRAAVNITQSSVPTVGLAGYHTHTLTASTDDGSQIQGFDFASQPPFGFFGPMKQINPAGNPTVFFFFCGLEFCDLSQDSHFLFQSNQLTIPAGFASEGPTRLRAVFASGTPWGTSVPFVQLVIPDGAAAQVAFTGQVQTVVGSTVTDNNVAGIVPVPEPAALGLLGVAVISGLGFVRRRAT